MVALHRPLVAPTGRRGLRGENVEVESYGNVLAATGFLYGLAASDLTAEELAARDPLYEVVIGLRAVKGLTVTGRAARFTAPTTLR